MIHCKYCKNAIESDARFCTSCGKNVDERHRQNQNQQNQHQQNQQNQQNQHQNQQNQHQNQHQNQQNQHQNQHQNQQNQHQNQQYDIELSIGRDDDNDIILDFPQISSHHACLIKQNNQWLIIDNKSTNGTYVNDRSKRISKQPIELYDIIFFGSYKIQADRILKMKKNTSLSKAGASISINNKETIFGRDPNATIPLDFPQVSWHHAKLTVHDDKFLLKDLGSTNGTFVNGKKISSCYISGNDIISLGSFRFQITPDLKIVKRDFRGDIRLDAENIKVKIKSNLILDDINFSIFPSELVGLMGPSGSGKTTLLLALNGYLTPTSGYSKINSESLYEKYDEFRQHIGYVPQDDIIHPELTVFEALYYTARLRLPKDITKKEIYKKIDTVLTQLGLFDKTCLKEPEYIDIRKIQIGSPEKKGISGGQRKRVNLAMELLTEPSLLFLDEPTSGLSSPDTLVVMKVLREIANSGKTVLLTIHQPGLEAYKMMDNVIVIYKGKQAYYGPAFPDAIKFFNEQSDANVLNSADNLLIGLEKGAKSKVDWKEQYEKSQAHKTYVKDRKSTPCNKKIINKPSHSFGWRQLITLTGRYLRIKTKDAINTAILLLQSPIIAGLISLVFYQIDVYSYLPLYLIIIAALWFGTSNASREIVGEKAIYIRERMVNLKIPSYVFSKFLVLSLLCLFQCAVLVGMIDYFLDIKGDLALIFGATFLSSLIGVGMGLFVSSVCKTQQAAVAIVPIVLLPTIILGGGLVHVSQMNEASKVLSYTIPSRWSFEYVTQIEEKSIPQDIEQTEKSLKKSWSVEKLFKDKNDEIILITILLCFIACLLAMTMMALKIKDKV